MTELNKMYAQQLQKLSLKAEGMHKQETAVVYNLSGMMQKLYFIDKNKMPSIRKAEKVVSKEDESKIEIYGKKINGKMPHYNNVYTTEITINPYISYRFSESICFFFSKKIKIYITLRYLHCVSNRGNHTYCDSEASEDIRMSRCASKTLDYIDSGHGLKSQLLCVYFGRSYSVKGGAGKDLSIGLQPSPHNSFFSLSFGTSFHSPPRHANKGSEFNSFLNSYEFC